MTADDLRKVYVIEQARYETGDVAGYSMTPGGEVLHSHISSSPGFLRLDTTEHFGRGKGLRDRFGDFEVVYVSVDDDLPAEIAHHFQPANEGDDEPLSGEVTIPVSATWEGDHYRFDLVQP